MTRTTYLDYRDMTSQKECEEHGQPVKFKLEDLVLHHIDVISRSRIEPVFDVLPAHVELEEAP